MKAKILAIVFFTFTFNTSFSQNGWFQQSSGTNYYLNSVCFYNNTTGWIAGGKGGFPPDFGLILKTTDGGNLWESQIVGSNTFNASYFTDNNTGWAVGNTGVIYKTINSGTNWSLQSTGNYYLSGISFVDNNTGWAVGNLGTILKTTNGGSNWISQTSGITNALLSVDFVNDSTGWAVGSFSGSIILKTTNGGTNWVTQTSGISFDLRCVQFLNNDTGWAVGVFNILKTTNGGTNWINQMNAPGSTFYSVQFINNNTGWVVGQFGNGLIFHTTNGGANWISQNATNHGLYSVGFANADTGYAVGYLGTILKTINGGQLTPVQNISSEIPKQFSLNQNYPNPFNPKTIISYQLSMNNFVSLKIYDVSGNEIATLVNEKQNAGTYSVDWEAGNFPSGVYFYKLQSGDFVETKRMTLIK